MKLLKQIAKMFGTTTEVISDGVVTAGGIVDNTLLSVHDYSDMLRQESMKSLLSIDNDESITDAEIDEYIARKERIASINKRVKSAVR